MVWLGFSFFSTILGSAWSLKFIVSGSILLHQTREKRTIWMKPGSNPGPLDLQATALSITPWLPGLLSFRSILYDQIIWAIESFSRFFLFFKRKTGFLLHSAIKGSKSIGASLSNLLAREWFIGIEIWWLSGDSSTCLCKSFNKLASFFPCHAL